MTQHPDGYLTRLAGEVADLAAEHTRVNRLDAGELDRRRTHIEQAAAVGSRPQDAVPSEQQAEALRYAMGGPAANNRTHNKQVVDRCKLLGWLRPDGHLKMPEGREALRRYQTRQGLDLFGRPLR